MTMCQVLFLICFKGSTDNESEIDDSEREMLLQNTLVNSAQQIEIDDETEDLVDPETKDDGNVTFQQLDNTEERSRKATFDEILE